ncbi:MAG: hypothetical protein RLN72_13830 [Henriciella sp.]
MDEDRDFIDLGLATAHDALENAAGLANLHLKPATITKLAARRLRQTLKTIERAVRMLIILLAASIELGPVRPRPVRGSDAARLRGPHKRGFHFLPVNRHPSQRPDYSALEQVRPRAPGPVPTGPIMDRIQTVFGLMRNPEPAARRLARRIEKLRALKVRAPTFGPITHLYRFNAEFGLIAAGLPDFIRQAHSAWYDSG